MLQCPSDIVVDAAAGNCFASFSATVTATDNCDIAGSVVISCEDNYGNAVAFDDTPVTRAVDQYVVTCTGNDTSLNSGT